MKNIFKLAVPALMVLATSCGWTEYENLDYRRPTNEEKDPQAYEEYLKAIRGFKQTDHKIMMLTMPGTSGQLTTQAQHPMSMPDSADFINMKNMDNLNPIVVEELAEVANRKGTRVLAYVDFTEIETAWNELQDAKVEAGEEPGTPEDFAKYCTEEATRALSYCDKYNMHGITFSFLSNTSTDNRKAGEKAFMEVVKTWRESHKDKIMNFRGYPQNISYPEIFQDCNYIIIVATSYESAKNLNVAIKGYISRLKDKLPTDRFVAEVAVPNADNPKQEGLSAVAAAEWSLEVEPTFAKAGMAVGNASDDYFRPQKDYLNIRQAITIMNTTVPETPEE